MLEQRFAIESRTWRFTFEINWPARGGGRRTTISLFYSGRALFLLEEMDRMENGGHRTGKPVKYRATQWPPLFLTRSSFPPCTADSLLIKPPAPLFFSSFLFSIYGFQKAVADAAIRRIDSPTRSLLGAAIIDAGPSRLGKKRIVSQLSIPSHSSIRGEKKFSPSIVVYFVALRDYYRARQSRASSIRSFEANPRGVISNRNSNVNRVS